MRRSFDRFDPFLASRHLATGTAGCALRLAFTLALAALALAEYDPALAAESPQGFPGRSELVVPTELCRDLFLVPLVLEPRDPADEPSRPASERTLWFAYDTGASATMVDPESLARAAATGVHRSGRVEIVNAVAGPVRFRSLSARVRNLDHLSRSLGRTIDGILAFDAFGERLLTLDYPGAELRLSDGALPPPDRVATFSTAGPDPRPWLELRLGEATTRVLVDSGAPRTTLMLANLDQLPTLAPPRPVGGSTRLERIDLRSGARLAVDATLGPHRFSRPVVEGGRGNQLLGGVILREFVWTFDFEHARLRVTPASPAATVEFSPLIDYGMVVVPTDEGLRVHTVLPDTPASASDLRPGDVITHMNGAPIVDRGCTERSTVENTFALLRDGVRATITVTMAPLVH